VTPKFRFMIELERPLFSMDEEELSLEEVGDVVEPPPFLKVFFSLLVYFEALIVRAYF